MPYAEIDGWKLVITDTGGDGPPVVFCHGDPHRAAAAGAYDGPAADLSDVYRVLTVRLRDDGSQPASDVWGPARAVFGLLDAIGIERVVLCGADDTAELLVRCALLHPDRVRGLALLHPDLAALHAAAARPGADPDLDHLDDRLEELAMPVVLVVGTGGHDADAGQAVAKARDLAAAVSDSRGVVEVPGAGAELTTTHAQPVATALRDYLEGLPA